MVSQLDPKIVIPMHFKIDSLNADLEGVENFLKEMALGTLEPQPKLSVTKDRLPDEMQVVVLNKS